MKIIAGSALDLKLRGSVGSFKIGGPTNKECLDVKYLLTHVGLNFEIGTDEKLLKELAPVREIFDFKSLDFDEIMQRDIDDARVSGELIPYILDDRSTDLVKFFPPIVVIVLPIEIDRNKPAKYYPAVTNEMEERNGDETGVDLWNVIQSGHSGKEVFKFEQPVVNDHAQLHDLVSLSLNTSKSRLVIVDGQHRAMALLALYRNLKDDWNDSKRKAFESYYKEWTPDYIRSFNLREIKLPMIICTMPELDEQFAERNGNYDLKKASRSIFLTLNKNARRVTRSRNLLLDDADLISSFMRKILSAIKNGDRNYLSDTSLEIHNVELDQAGDKQTITSPMAFTGVTHLYYIVEHLMLDDNDINGISKREGRFATRKKNQYFARAHSRLNTQQVLGADALSSITRDIFSVGDEEVLSKQFTERYGSNIVYAFSKFAPFDDFSKASQVIKSKSQRNADVHISPMLFDGQGISRVFEKHREALSLKLKENYFKNDKPKVEEFKRSLDATNENYMSMLKDFRNELASVYYKDIPGSILLDDAGSVCDEALKFSDFMFNNVFSTVAFQAALICGFYTEFEKISKTFDGTVELDLESLFQEYIYQLNGFLKPKSFAKVKSMINLFYGHAEGDSFSDIRIVKDTSHTFRNVVFPGEMNPDEWPKYKYLLLEIWSPSSEDFSEMLNRERQKCREAVIKSLYSRNLAQYCKTNFLKQEEVPSESRIEVFHDSFESYKKMLKSLGRGSTLNEVKLKNLVMGD